MKQLILFLFLLYGMAVAQPPLLKAPFVAGNDTIFTTSSDTVEVQIGVGELPLGEWQALASVIADNDTVYITSDDKAAERTKIFSLALESWWTWCDLIRFRIRAEDDTLTSPYISIGSRKGQSSLFVQPTIYGDATVDTILYKVRFGTR